MPPDSTALLNQGLQQFHIAFKDAGNMFCDRNWDTVDSHFPCDSIGFIKSGTVWMRVGSKEALIEAGGLYYIPAGFCYSHRVIGKSAVVYWTHFNLGLAGGTLGSGLDFPLFVPAHAETPELFEAICESRSSTALGAPLQVTGLMYQLVAHFFALCGNRIQPLHSEKAQQMWTVARYIGDNLSKNLTVELLAAQVRLNPNYFIKVFSAFFHETPIHYVLSRREAQARTLLERSDMSIKQIGLCLGFSNQNYFSEFFKKRSGYSPTEYRLLKNISAIT